MLIVHGSNDALVTSRETRALAAALPDLHDFIEIPGAVHADVVTIGGDALLERILQFLREATGPSSL